jgi:glucose dehydrogenase
VRSLRFLALAAIWIATGPMWSCTRTTQAGEWRFYASDPASTKFSPLAKIEATNVGGLRLAWRWISVDESLRRAMASCGRGRTKPHP